jgi:hypothetical protein
MADPLVRLEEHIIVYRSDGIPRRLPQDKILYGDKLIGYVGTQKNAPVCLTVHGLPDSIKGQIKTVVADRDAKLHGTNKFESFADRKISQPPKLRPEDGASG